MPPRPPTEQEQTYITKGFTLPEARHIVRCLDIPAIAQQITAPLTAITSDEIVRYRTAGLVSHEMLICKNWGLAVPEYLEFKTQTIHLNQKTTLRGRYTVAGSPIGRGCLNSVYELGVHNFQDGAPALAIGKKMLKEAHGWVSSRIGIPNESPRYLSRNVLAYLMSKLLWPVIPRTEPVLIDGTLGIVMEKAPGTSPTRTYDYELSEAPELRFYSEALRKYCEEKSKPRPTLIAELRTEEAARKNLASYLKIQSVEENGGKILMCGVRAAIGGIPFEHPALHLELQKLQFIDAIMGEGDRHSGNYFVCIHPTSGVISIMGIDNEQCAGALTTDPEMLVRGLESDREHEGYRGLRLPRYIHEEIAQKISNLTDQQIVDTATGLLHTNEIEAMLARVGKIWGHIRAATPIRSDRWPEIVQEMLAHPEEHKDSSYAVRDANTYRTFITKGQPTRLYGEAVAPPVILFADSFLNRLYSHNVPFRPQLGSQLTAKILPTLLKRSHATRNHQR